MLRVNPKEVENGDTFLALPGIDDDQIKLAIEKGATCIISDHGDFSVKTIIEKDTRTYLSNYLKELNIEKFDKIKIIGIVGTSGKTVTGEILCQLLNNLNSKTSCISTNGFYLNGEVENTKETTPDIYELYEYINKSIENECENIIIEVSSEAVIKRYIEGLRFDIVIFTNLYALNRDFEKYMNTKIEVFKMLKKNGLAIINKQDDNYKYFTLPQNHNIFYASEDSEYKINNIYLSYENTIFDINENRVNIPLIGMHNVYNYLAAYTTLREMHFPYEAIMEVTNKLNQIEGRYQKIKYKDNLIVIDYAYNYEIIKNALNITKKICLDKIITIIGIDDDKDEVEISKIGDIVTSLSNYVIFTTNNLISEETESKVVSTINNLENNNYEIIADRKDAIKKGIELLKEKDILLILGRGGEKKQNIDGMELVFNDYNEIIKNIK